MILWDIVMNSKCHEHESCAVDSVLSDHITLCSGFCLLQKINIKSASNHRNLFVMFDPFL